MAFISNVTTVKLCTMCGVKVVPTVRNKIFTELMVSMVFFNCGFQCTLLWQSSPRFPPFFSFRLASTWFLKEELLIFSVLFPLFSFFAVPFSQTGSLSAEVRMQLKVDMLRQLRDGVLLPLSLVRNLAPLSTSYTLQDLLSFTCNFVY